MTVVVESNDPDEGIRVLSFAFLNFLQHLSRVSASEQGKLPHCPVTAIVVSGGASVLTVHKSVLQLEFNTRNPLVAEKVLLYESELSTGEAWWLVGDETDALDLTVVVESDDPDEGVRVLRFALLDFLQHLSRVSASEQGKLPHCPVTSIVVSGGASVLTVNKPVLQLEFNTRNPLVAEKVVDFLTQFNFGKVRKVREGLKLLLSNWWPHLHAANSSSVACNGSNVVVCFAGDWECSG